MKITLQVIKAEDNRITTYRISGDEASRIITTSTTGSHNVQFMMTWVVLIGLKGFQEHLGLDDARDETNPYPQSVLTLLHRKGRKCSC